MLSLFPVHFLAPIAYILLRLCVGFIFVRFAHCHLQKRELLVAGVEILVGIGFLLGLFTQLAALIALVYTTVLYALHERFAYPKGPTKQTLVLLFFISLSLFITGPGILAFDLPI
mgnify:CR=1 FL=1